MKVIYNNTGHRFYVNEKNNVSYPSVSTILSSASDYPFKPQYKKNGEVKKQNLLFANIGSVIHYHCLKSYNSDTLSPLPSITEYVRDPNWINEKIQNSYNMWSQFLHDFKPKFISAEQLIRYEDGNIRYAGRCDALAIINGKYTILDIKTGNYYPYYNLQIAAYANALKPLPDMGLIVQLDSHLERNPKLNYKLYTFSPKEMLNDFNEFYNLAEIYFKNNKV